MYVLFCDNDGYNIVISALLYMYEVFLYATVTGHATG